MVERGDVAACVVGGAEAAVTPLSVAAFARMGATSESGVSMPVRSPPRRVRDGRGRRDLVLEDAERAAERGATVLGA